MQTPNDITAVLERLLPVGSIVEWSPVDSGEADLSTPEKVAAYYGFGTWEAYGSGRMLLGVSDGHAIGSTGGDETHTHPLSGARAEITFSGSEIVENRDMTTGFRYNVKSTIGSVSGTTGSIGHSTRIMGSTDPVEWLPPYITIYRWRRIA